jgi:hypothetical protein
MNWEGLWNYIRERERVRLRKEGTEPWPWTEDRILQQFKFTNVKRIHDRTTQVFYNIYQENAKDTEQSALYNCALYRYFGTAEWAGLVGWQHFHDGEFIRLMAETAKKRGLQIFTGAYVITNSGQTGPKYRVVEQYLAELWHNIDRIVKELNRAFLWEDGYHALHQLPGFGGSGFMAKEVLQDYLLWAPYRFHDDESFTPIGPGAMRGLGRVVSGDRNARFYFKEGLSLINQIRDTINPLWGDAFYGPAWDGPLTAHDIQFCLCEFDKYERVRLGQGRPRSIYHHGVQGRLFP